MSIICKLQSMAIRRLSIILYLCNMFRKYPFSLALVGVIWVICLIPIPESPLSHVRFIDKWTHLVMYATLCLVVWWEASRQRTSRVLLLTWLLPVLMGGLVELAQRYCTGGVRSGDWLDFLANATGATLAQPIGWWIFKRFWKTGS